MRLHHVGYVVRDIGAFAAGFPGLVFKKSVEDPLQNAELALYDSGGTYLEFIRPFGPKSFTWAHLERHGESFHHTCFEGARPDEIDGVLRAHRLVKLRGPMPAVLLGRPVVFAASRARAILEFVL